MTPPDPVEVATQIRERLDELADLARDAGLPQLAYMIEMAALEVM